MTRKLLCLHLGRDTSHILPMKWCRCDLKIAYQHCVKPSVYRNCYHQTEFFFLNCMLCYLCPYGLMFDWPENQDTSRYSLSFIWFTTKKFLIFAQCWPIVSRFLETERSISFLVSYMFDSSRLQAHFPFVRSSPGFLHCRREKSNCDFSVKCCSCNSGA